MATRLPFPHTAYITCSVYVTEHHLGIGLILKFGSSLRLLIALPLMRFVTLIIHLEDGVLGLPFHLALDKA